ncbi:MAG: FAD-binding oxidoreductase [Sphingobium sp.]|nr:FAD-binding oxidoreductase [Sphingobium sp.]
MTSRDFIPHFRNVLGPKGVITDEGDIAPWVSDWRGRWHGATPAILAPASTQEVAAVIALARDHQVQLVPQGGNTSMVGGATPPADGRAFILSLRRMNAIRELSADHNRAVCEAGVILSTLHEAAEGIGRRFPLSLGAKGSATIGGLVSTNAGGTQVLRHGTMRGLVEGLEAVLPNGEIYDGLAALKKDNRGYDIKHLLIGAEGTLGVVTAASLRLVPALSQTATAWVGVERPHDALTLLRQLQARFGNNIEGFEVIAGDGLGHVLSHIPSLRSPIDTPAPWHALIEFDISDARDASEAEMAIATAITDFMEAGHAIDATIASNKAQAEAFWRIRESLSEAERAQGPALQFDISVPVEAMPDYMVNTAKAAELRFPGTTASSFGHLGDGNVHFHVRAPKGTSDGPAWLAQSGEEISRFVHDAVMAAGGSISAEHGIGQMKRAELGRLSSPARLFALRAIKSAMDPSGILNPGKLIPLASEG